MTIVFAAPLERVDMRLLGAIVMVLRFCPSVHGVACEYRLTSGNGKKGAAKTALVTLRAEPR